MKQCWFFLQDCMIWWEIRGNGRPHLFLELDQCMCCVVPPGLTRWMDLQIIRLGSRPGELMKEKKITLLSDHKSTEQLYSSWDWFCVLQDGQHSWLCLWQPGIQVCCHQWTETSERQSKNWTVETNRESLILREGLSHGWLKMDQITSD